MPAAAIRLRNLTEADLAFAMRLKALAGWNQTEADWRRFLELEPSGCFMAEFEGRPAGTVTVLTYERRIGWIGMMLVDPERRRRGIASALLEHALEYLAERGVETAKLDATPVGKTVYDQHGFRDEYRLERRLRADGAVTASAGEAGTEYDGAIRSATEKDLEQMAQLDAAAFGAGRRRLIEALWRDAPSWCFVSGEGFVMARRGALATQIGPLVAADVPGARRLLGRAIGAIGPGPTLLDVPLANEAATAVADEFGFVKQRELIRQYRGPNRFAGQVQKVFAIAGPELG